MTSKSLFVSTPKVTSLSKPVTPYGFNPYGGSSYDNNNSCDEGCDNICINLINSSVFKSIEDLLQHYNNSDFQYVIDNLSLEKYNELSFEIHELSEESNDPCYQIIREYVVYTLRTLYQAVLNILENQDLTNRANSLLAETKVLSDYKKLKQYLERMKDSMGGIFKNYEVTATTAKIKPQYQIYIQKYGFPKNGIFDPDLLGPILENLHLYNDKSSDTSSLSSDKNSRRSITNISNP